MVVHRVEDECCIASNVGKTRVYSLAGGPPPPGVAELGTDVWGTPVGHSEYVRAWATTRAHEERHLLEQLPRLPDLQCAWLLLAMCASCGPSPPPPTLVALLGGLPPALWRGSPLRSEAWVCSRLRAWHRRPIGLPGLMPCRYSERGCRGLLGRRGWNRALLTERGWCPQPSPGRRLAYMPRMASSCRGSPPSPPCGRRPGRLAAWLAKPRVAYPEPSLPRQRAIAILAARRLCAFAFAGWAACGSLANTSARGARHDLGTPVALRRRLRLALPLHSDRCGPSPGCGAQVDTFGDHALAFPPAMPR